jgi:6-phosphogluconolactonase
MIVYFGTFTDPLAFVPESRGAGIVACELNTKTGQLEQCHVTDNIRNPNYLALEESGTMLFAVTCDMNASCHVHAYRRAAGGRLIAAGSQPTGARVGCHICAMPHGRVCVSSYLDSSIAVFPAHDGTIGPCEFHYRYRGRSVNDARQEDSHAHQAVVSPDDRWLYVVDLGTDRIWCHQVANISAPPAFTATPPGSGPRHAVFHPTLPRLYLLCELNAHVLTFDWQPETGRLQQVGDVPSLPENWPGVPAGAAIRVHPNGTLLYVSNRNRDSLDYFSLDREGLPARSGDVACGGNCPRDFAIDPAGQWLVVGNQDSHQVAVHELDAATGLPTGGAPQIIALGSPACVLL